MAAFVEMAGTMSASGWNAAARLGVPGRHSTAASGDAATAHVIGFEADIASDLSDAFAGAGLRMQSYLTVERFTEMHHTEGSACIILDLQGQADLGCLLALRRWTNGLPVVVAAERADIRTVVAVMKAGAADFVEKPICEHALLDAVNAAIDANRGLQVAATREAEVWRRFKTLTPREREVMALVTQGRLNKQAAGDLGLSEITVKAHRGAATRKMAARTIADLVRMSDLLASMQVAETEIFRSAR